MDFNQQRIAALEKKINQLSELMGANLNELNSIRAELKQLRSLRPSESEKTEKSSAVMEMQNIQMPENLNPSPFSRDYEKLRQERNRKWETLIGTNIINKIGILVLLIGVYIGVKYAIDNQLISPALRIILGYGMVVALATTSWMLKKKYVDFSAVMMGGAIAVAYFNTYVAHSFYQLIPQWTTFGMMLITTAVSVWMAILFNQKIIALLGQVGAYAIPFLLSKGNGNVANLFAYVCIVNLGLLYLSVKRDWKAIYLLAFVASWIIFLVGIQSSENTITGLTFSTGLIRLGMLTIHFVIFLSTFLFFKLFRKENYQLREIMVLLINALLYFAASSMVIWEMQLHQGNQTDRTYPSLFTFVLGCLHLLLGFLVNKRQAVDKTVHLFLGGLGIVFLTISVPIAFSGNTITVLWATESAVLAWIYQRYQRKLYHDITLILFTLTGLSLVMDWSNQYLDSYTPKLIPFLNAPYLSCIFTGICLSFISFSYARSKEANPQSRRISFGQITGVSVFLVLFLSTFFEIKWTFPFFIAKWAMMIKEPSLTITLIFFSLIYLIIWTLLNLRFIKRQDLHQLLTILSFMGLLIMLASGLEAISDLRHFYLQQHSGHAFMLLGIRYVFVMLIALLLFVLKKADGRLASTSQTTDLLRLLFNITLLTILCNEFIHWMDILGYPNQDKLGVSIISGLYALTLVISGILKNRKAQRISGIVLMGLTLLKIFFYDLSNMSNISKTMVLIIMGLILLLASYMYNRFLEKMKNEES